MFQCHVLITDLDEDEYLSLARMRARRKSE